MKKEKTTLAVLLICLSVFICSCKKMSVETATNTNSNADETELLIQSVYLPDDMCIATSQFVNDGKVYVCGVNYDGSPAIVCFDGESFSDLPVPNDIEYIHCGCAVGEDIYVIGGDCPRIWYTSASNFRINDKDSNYGRYILHYDSRGELIDRTELEASACAAERCEYVTVINAYMYILSGNTLYQTDLSGSLIESFTAENGDLISMLSHGGRLYLLTLSYESSSYEITVSVGDGIYGFEAIFSTDKTIYGFAFDENGELIINDGSAFIKAAGEEVYFDLLKNGILDGLQYVGLEKLDNDRYLLEGTLRKDISVLTLSEPMDKTELTIWVRDADRTVSELINGFNRSSSKYRLKIELINDYTDDQLRAEILIGKGPDIFYTGSGSSFSTFNGKAIFEDLTPYIEAYDSEGTKLFMPVVNAMKEQDSLYKLPLSFSIYTMSARSDLFPDGNMSVTEAMQLDEVISGEIPLFSEQMSREELLYWLSSIYLSNHIRADSDVSCDFENEEYIALLEGCGAVKSSAGAAPEKSIFSFQQIPGIMRLTYLYKEYGENFMLLPGENTVFSINHSFAISAASENKAGAWSFLEYSLKADLSDEQFLWPVSSYAMDRMLQNAEHTGVYMLNYSGYVIYSESFVNNFRLFLDGCSGSGIMGNYPDLEQIMQEEANKYFAHQCSAAEAAAATQKRANIFLAEKYS